MTLDGAINLSETNDYIVYTMNSVTTGQYGVVVPKNITGTLNMLVDLHMKNSFDGVGNGSKTKEQLVNEITSEYDKLKTKYADGMLVMPMIDDVSFQTIVNNGDKQKMFDEVKKIGAITSELYKKLTDQGVDKQKIDQKIIIVEKTNEDERFVTWLKEQSNMANFVDGIRYSELNSVQEVVNPFVDNNSIFGPVQQVTPVVTEPVASTPVSNGGIFDNPVPPVAPVSFVEEPVVPSAQVVPESVPVMPVENVVPQAETVVNQTPSVNVDLFGNPTTTQNTAVASTPVQSAPAQNTVVPEAPVVPNPAPVVEGPKPVESAMLEGTIAFTPIPNHPNNPTEGVATDNQAIVESSENKSKGFANLLIILIILAGVTIASIELGKYLYSVYGA